jgi:ABC-type transport system involved in multi-copper enzyme maturation permease subunit
MTRPKEPGTRPRRRGLQPVQLLAGLVGLVYLALGIIGLIITGFGGFGDATHSTLWLFSINPFHNVVYIVIGALGVLMALTSKLARTYGWLVLVAFGVLVLWGLAITGVFSENPVSGLGNPLALNTADNWLHFGTALLGLVIAVMPARKKIPAMPGQERESASGAMAGRRPEAGAGETRRHAPGRRIWRRGTAH